MGHRACRVHGDQLVGAGVTDEGLELLGHAAGLTDRCVREHLVDLLALRALEDGIDIGVIERLAAPAEHPSGQGASSWLELLPGGLIRVGSDDVDAGDDVRLANCTTV